MDFDQMMPVAVAMAEAGHAIRIGVMGNQLNINNDPRLSLLPERPKIWQLNQPLTRLKCRLFMRGISCLVMDWARRDHGVTEILTNIARKKSIYSVSLPHGIDHVSDPSYYQSLDRKTFDHFDFIVVPNHIRRDVLINLNVSEDRIRVLGALRYTNCWSKRLSNIYPPRNTDDGRLKVVLFDIPVPQKYGETVATIKLLLTLPTINLVIQIKPIPISENGPPTLSSLFPNNIDQTHASQLCRWADVVLGTSSSVMFEALIQKKQLVYLRHLEPDTHVFLNYKSNWVVESDDDLMSLIKRFNQTKAVERPDAKPLIREILHGGLDEKEVKAGYIEFLANTALQSSGSNIGIYGIHRT